MTKIDVSVIIPYYQSKDTIDRAINSILNQTVLPKEIIIVDDFSNNSEDMEKIKELSLHEFIKIFELDKNSGPGIARNIGILNSKSKYIAFLDSDDSWHSRKLEIQYNIMEDTGVDLTTHGSSIIEEGDFNEEKIKRNNISFKYINKYKQLFSNQFSTRSVMMRKDLNFLFHDKRRAEDYLLWTQLLFNSKKALKIEANLSFSYKLPYGESGLTKSLFKMYISILHSYYILFKKNDISFMLFVLVLIVSILKFLIRFMKFYYLLMNARLFPKPFN